MFMAHDEPVTVVHTELSPEFDQFVLGTGDVLRAAEQLSTEAIETVNLGAATDNAVLFALRHEVSEVRITVEIWRTQPGQSPSVYVDSLETSIAASDTALKLTSITPSPRDLVIQLPRIKRFVMQAFVLSRELQHDPDFNLDLNIEQWLIRLW
jgi:hypothetical protein